MKLIVVNDANILIDFCELQLLDVLFELDYDFCTVDVVWEELREDQQEAYRRFLEMQRFRIDGLDEAQIMNVYTVRMERPQLSIPDCTALVYAEVYQGVLLTSDKNLRSAARQYQVDVRGHLWIFDEWYDQGIMDGEMCIQKLDELCSTVNLRLELPEDECKKRIRMWKNEDSFVNVKNNE